MRDIVVSDLDGTLVADNGDPIQAVLAELLDKQSEGYAVVIVSGRQADRFDETKAWLAENGLNVNDADIHLSDFPPGPNASREFKVYKAKKLIEAGDVIDEWFENDPDTITALMDLGIEVQDAAAYRALEYRAVDAPVFMQDAAKTGLRYFAQGFAGSGLQDATVREARLMARGTVSVDKWQRIAAWVARHRGDWEGVSRNSDPKADGFPGPGAVAAYLWGVDPTEAGSADKVIETATQAVESESGNNDTMQRVSVVEPEPAARRFNNPKGNQMLEYRSITTQDFEVRADATADGMSFSGYAAVFDSPSEPLPFTETIAPGAFRRSLKTHNEVKMFVNHNSDQVLASKKAGTLRLREDAKGLFVEADLPDTTYARDLSVLLRRGDVTSMSFGFSVPAGGDSWSDGMTRRLNEVRLHEVSVVTGFPAYEATSASVRSLVALAQRTNLDADALAAALTLLENGQELDDDKAGLVIAAVERLRPAKDEEQISVSGTPTAILAKKLELLAKSI